ncbi:MAG: GAF domain-containing protein [Deltaproteobacteria bacterium]|nr:GAF domain-containing protein [Deltaproteobacteria bacterium]
MKKLTTNYDTLLKITGAISATRDPEDIVVLTVESVKTAMDVKGCTLFLINRKTDELKIAGSYGLSQNYLDKGPISSLKSIAESFKEGPVAIFDVTDDPRIQYPEEAKKEGISSILSVPITLHDRVIGALRVYTSEPWEFTLEDVNFVHAVAQIVGMSIDLCRLNKGYKTSIEILKTMRAPELLKTK